MTTLEYPTKQNIRKRNKKLRLVVKKRKDKAGQLNIARETTKQLHKYPFIKSGQIVAGYG